MTNFTQNQSIAVNTLHSAVSVSAGAGSGKTRVLVERYVNILEDAYRNNIPLSARNILCITFTKKAAAEMKERIRVRLTEKERESGAKEYWKGQKSSFDQARIGTIHGLCSALLRENPVEANLDPEFKVAEESEMEEFTATTVYDFVKGELARGNSSAMTLAAAYGGEKLVELLLYLWRNIDDILSCGDLKSVYLQSAKDREKYLDELLSCVNELIDLIPEITAKKHKEELKYLESGYSDVVNAVRNFAGEEELDVLKKYLAGLSAKAKQDKEIVQEVRELLKKIEASLLDALALPYIDAWTEVLQNCRTYLRTKQEAMDWLGFDDLERMTLELLERNPELCVKYRNIFKFVMVDEFQDTNNRQKEIIYLLCGGDKTKLNAQNLFIVGDPKQSIYRFRGADVSVFAEVRKEIDVQNGKSIVLSDNFRTVDKILDVCNIVFRDLLGEDRTKSVYFEELIANRHSESLPEIIAAEFDKDTNQLKRLAEAQLLADRVKALHEAEGLPYGEMVFLLAALTHAEVYADALRANGIPVQLVDAGGFYEKQEILDLTNLLKFCADDSNILELAGVLRSPYFALSDATITKLFLSGAQTNQNLWEILQSELSDDCFTCEEREHINHCADVLERLKTSATYMPVNEFVSVVTDLLPIEAILLTQDGGKDKLANLKKYIELINAFTLERHASLKDWLSNVALMRKLKARVGTGGNDSGADCVKIMTVHKSKGLEFPVVVLPALDSNGKSDSSDVYFTKAQGLGIKVPCNDVLAETSVYKAIKEQEKILDEEEKNRLLYVAMTRAENRLIMSGAIKKEKPENNKFSRLCEILNGHKDKINMDFVDAGSVGAATKQTDEENKISLVISDDVLKQTEPLAMYGKAWQRKLSATALQKYEHCPRSYYYAYVMQMPGIEAEAESATAEIDPLALGSVVHEVLSEYDGDVNKLLYPAAEKYSLSKAGTAEAKKMLEQYLASALYQDVAGKKQEHEAEFNLPLLEAYGIDAMFHGFIDCLVFNDDGTATIIDYKTGLPPKDGEMDLGYRYQLALYKAAVEKIHGVQVASSELHYLKDCSVRKLADDCMDEIAQKVRQIFAKNEEEDFACKTSGCKFCPYSYFCGQS